MKSVSFLKINSILFIISVLIIAAFGFVDIPKAKQGDVDAFAGYVDRTVSDHIRRNGKGAVAVGIIHEGKIFRIKGYGYQDAEQKIPITDNTVFQVASISKSFTAWAVMDLVEGDSLAVMAVQRADGELGQSEGVRLADLIHSRQSPRG